jgi:hypothetical protein
MMNLLNRILGRLDSMFELSEWAAFFFAALGIGCAIWALVRKRELGGLVAMLLASLAAGAGVLGQLRTERIVEQGLADKRMPSSTMVGRVRLLGPRETRASIERQRREIMPEVQVQGQRGALASLLPLVLGAIAALWKPRGSRMLAFGFLGLGALVCLGAMIISHRPPPLDRYAFDGNDDAAWGLAIALDRAEDIRAFSLEEGAECLSVEGALDPYWGATDRTEWPRVMRKPVPPELTKAADVFALGCAIHAFSEVQTETDDAQARQLRDELLRSVLLRDEKVHARVVAWGPPTAEERAAARAEISEKLRKLFGPVPERLPEIEQALGLDGGPPAAR